MFERGELNHEEKKSERQRGGKALPVGEASRCTVVVKKSKAQSARGREPPEMGEKLRAFKTFSQWRNQICALPSLL